VTQTYRRFIDQRPDFREVAHQSKLLILRAAVSSDLQLLAHRLNRISERHRQTRDFTLHSLRTALLEILACFPVYRTYIREGETTEGDRQFVCRAVAQAKRRHPVLDAALFDFARDVLLLQAPPGLDDAGRRQRELFVGRFQQLTSPVMAKGIEDTAFYRYFPLSSLNEVGGDPVSGPTSVEEFHRQNLARQARWPFSLIATTTHDTKRSEDLRARINVLSEIPNVWRTAINRWARLNRRHRREVAGQPAPSRNDEYLFYQSLVGVWPLDTGGTGLGIGDWGLGKYGRSEGPTPNPQPPIPNPSSLAQEVTVALVVAPRLIAQLTPFPQDALAVPPPLGAAVWQDTYITVAELGLSRLTNVFTGEVRAVEESRLSVAAAFCDFPVGLFC
jgi:maltooligosyltrehalose synthase